MKVENSETAAVLKAGFALAHQRLGLIFLDLLWKSIWFGVTALLVGGAGLWLIGRLTGLQWQGPDLGLPQSIILTMAVREFWRTYWQTAIAALAIIVGLAVLLRIALEAYFRGGARYFWIFAGSRVARTAILSALALILGLFVWSDRTAGIIFVAAVVLLGTWFVATVVETLIRKDAVELLAEHLPVIAAGMGLLLMFEALSALFLAGVSTAAILMSSRPWEFLAAIGLAAISATMWSVLESYLVVVRFSMVDIMRGEQ